MSITQTHDRLEVVHEDRAQHPAPLAEGDPGTRPSFTITDAATACAVSRKTITRKLVELGQHGAAKDQDGIWRIPVEALLAVGLHPGRSVPEAPRPNPAGPQTTGAPVPSGPDTAEMVSVPRDRWDDLRIRLARAEAEAAERALALADARLALRALTAGPSASVHSVQGPASSPGDSPSGQRESRVPSDAWAEVAPRAAMPMATAPASPSTVPEADLASARSHSARDGGHVPAVAADGPAKKRRWWQSR